MFKLIVLFSAIACTLGAHLPIGRVPQSNGRIAGGAGTDIESFPWTVSIQRNGVHFCGGSVYNSTIVVTAAHCLLNVSASDLFVRAGSTSWSSGGVLVSVAAIKKNEKFNATTMENDIAVIRLNTALPLSKSIQAAPLTTKPALNGASASVTGWGTIAYGSSYISPALRYVNVQIIGRSECASPTYQYGNAIKSNMFCAGSLGKDACKGDDGGPLVNGGYLIGVVSWGYGCAWPENPGVYTDVYQLSSWIVSAAKSV